MMIKNIKQGERLMRLPVAVSIFLLVANSSAFAQGCAMCKSSIAGSSDAASLSAKINLGILVLLVPVVLILSAMIVLVYRYRDSFATVEAEPSQQLLPGLDCEAESGLLSPTTSTL